MGYGFKGWSSYFSNNLLLLNKVIYLIKKMKYFDVYKGK